MLQSILQLVCICGCICNHLVDVAIPLVWPKLPYVRNDETCGSIAYIKRHCCDI
jgi:hypothetical protein